MPPKVSFHFPNTDHRADAAHVAVVGRTGSGKTLMGVYLLSQTPFDVMPWIIIDFKGDELISRIPAKYLSLDDMPPKQAGIYILQPRPDQTDELEAFLWRVWERGNCGIYVDEGTMVAQNKAYNAILTQGRSKRIPTITNTQRPVFANRYMFSEASYFSIFHLNKKDDNKKVTEYTKDFDFTKELPAYHSRWYDVKHNKFYLLRPVPNSDNIINIFENKLQKDRTFI